MQALQNAVSQLVNNEALSVGERLEQICELLRSRIAHYDWVGFYFHEDATQTLKLRGFAGEPTDHTTIPFGKGICGQVAVSNENFIVQDVSRQSNYLSCNWKVKSEIVIPILVNGVNIGQIDIDSHTIHPFDDDDKELLEFVCSKIATLMK